MQPINTHLLALGAHVARAQLLHQTRHHTRVAAARVRARLVYHRLARVAQHRIDAPVLRHVRHLDVLLQRPAARLRQLLLLAGRLLPLGRCRRSRRPRALHQTVQRATAGAATSSAQLRRRWRRAERAQVAATAAQHLRRHAPVLRQHAPMVDHLRHAGGRDARAVLLHRLQAQQNLRQSHRLVVADAAPAAIRADVLLARAHQALADAIVAGDQLLATHQLLDAGGRHVRAGGGLVAQQAPGRADAGANIIK